MKGTIALDHTLGRTSEVGSAQHHVDLGGGIYGPKRFACQRPTVRYWMAAWSMVFCAVNFRIA